jgi:hypothetical protein
VDVWGGEPSIADIVDVDTERPVAQTVPTKVARFIVATCASSESMSEDDLKLLSRYEHDAMQEAFDVQADRVVGLCRMVREQDKRARHAEQERDAFAVRIRKLEAEVAHLRKMNMTRETIGYRIRLTIENRETRWHALFASAIEASEGILFKTKNEAVECLATLNDVWQSGAKIVRVRRKGERKDKP